MHNFLKTVSGVMLAIAIIAFIVVLVESAAELRHAKKTAQQGATTAKKKPVVKIIAIIVTAAAFAGAVITDTVAGKAKETTPAPSPNSAISRPATAPTKYEKMRDEIIVHLSNHNDVSKMFDSVSVEWNNGKVEFNVTLEAYETYTFAAVTSATTDIVRKLVKEYDIEAYRLWVHSPSDAKYTISWISFNLDAGTINDNGYNGKYSDTIRLDAMLKHYGYEDYEGNLSDFLKNQNSLNS